MNHVSRKHLVFTTAITLLCICAFAASVSADTKDLKITSPSAENRLAVYDAANLHLFVFGGDSQANTVRLVRFDKNGKVKGDDEVYDAGSKLLSGLDAVGTRNGYLVSFWEYDKSSGGTAIKVLRVITESEPVTGIGEAAIQFVTATVEKEVATRAHADLAGVDAAPVGATTLFGLDPYNSNAKKRKWGVHGVVSLADAGGNRALDVLSASFLIKYTKKTAFLKVKFKDTSAAFAPYTDLVPVGVGKAGLVGNRAQWYFSLKVPEDVAAAPAAITDGYRAYLFTDIARNFPFSTSVEVDSYIEEDEKVYEFCGFAANSLRAFYADIRYNVVDGDLVPNRITGYERSDSGVRFNARIEALIAPPKRAANSGPVDWRYLPMATMALPQDRFMHAGVQQQVYDSAGSSVTDCRLLVTKWDLNEGGPVEMNKETVPLNRGVHGLSMARFIDPNQPFVMVYGWKDMTKAGSSYSFSLVRFKVDLDVIGK